MEWKLLYEAHYVSLHLFYLLVVCTIHTPLPVADNDDMF